MLSRKPEILDWIKDHKPLFFKGRRLLSTVDEQGWTIAHYAAWLGETVLLDWVMKNRPLLLSVKDRKHLTIAHYAAQSGAPSPLHWIADHVRELLTTTADNAPAIAASATLSGNAEQVNLALHQSANRHEISLKNIDQEQFQKNVIPTLLRVLMTNYTLACWSDLPDLTIGLVEVASWVNRQIIEINGLLANNRARLKQLNDTSYVFSALLFQSPEFQSLPRDLLLEIFTNVIHAISPRIPNKDIKAQFNKLIHFYDGKNHPNEKARFNSFINLSI